MSNGNNSEPDLEPYAADLGLDTMHVNHELHHASDNTFVAIHFEERQTIEDGVEIAEVDLAVLYCAFKDGDADPIHQSLLDWKQVQVFNWKTPVSRSLLDRRSDPDNAQDTGAEYLQQVLTVVLKMIRYQVGKPLFLVGLSLEHDLTMIMLYFPLIANEFFGCIDLQKTISRLPRQMRDRHSLIRFLNVSTITAYVPRTRGIGANLFEAASHTVAVLRTLICFDDGPLNVIERTRAPRRDIAWLPRYELREARPVRSDIFDMPIRVNVRGKSLRSVIQTDAQLYNFFPGYKPYAAIIDKDDMYAWLCLRSEQETDEFIVEFDKQEFKGVTWSACVDSRAPYALFCRAADRTPGS